MEIVILAILLGPSLVVLLAGCALALYRTLSFDRRRDTPFVSATAPSDRVCGRPARPGGPSLMALEPGVRAASQPSGAATCRICGAALGAPVVDLGESPLCERFLSTAMLDLPEPIFPLQVHLCPELRPRPTPRVRPSRRDLHRVLLLLVVLEIVGRARSALRRANDRRTRAGARQPGHRGREQRRLPAPALPRSRHRHRRDRTGAEHRGGGERGRYPNAPALLRRGAGRRAGCLGHAGPT